MKKIFGGVLAAALIGGMIATYSLGTFDPASESPSCEEELTSCENTLAFCKETVVACGRDLDARELELKICWAEVDRCRKGTP